MLLSILLLASLLGIANSQELGTVHMRLEGMREKCLVEELPENTVALGNSKFITHLIA